MKKILLPLLLLPLTACSVGPDYLKPDIHLPEGWFSTAKNVPVVDEKAEIEQQWWRHFNDPVLNQLVDKAVAGNLDLKIAEARIAEARAVRSGERADLWPRVDATAGDTRQANRFTFGNAPPGITKPFNTFQAGFDASWEPDVFGGKRRAVEAGTAELKSAVAARDDARVSLLAEVARTYIDIRASERQLALAKETIEAERRTVGITDENYRAGRAPQLDLMQARAQMEQVQAQLPYYENMLAQAEYSMDVLMGEQPGAAHALIGENKPLPAVDDGLVLAAPSKVIANRPDIRMAEENLKAATAERGLAAAQFFPDLSLSGFIGVLNVDAGDLLKSGSKSWSAGGNILAPILNYGKLSANLHAADARQQQALAEYQKAVIAALSDVAKSVTAYSRQQEYTQALDKTVESNRKTADIAHARYREGLSSFLDVLDAERALYAAQSQQAQAGAQTLQDLVAVYKSLGGGWR